jgi:hypothetical protein
MYLIISPFHLIVNKCGHVLRMKPDKYLKYKNPA